MANLLIDYVAFLALVMGLSVVLVLFCELAPLHPFQEPVLRILLRQAYVRHEKALR